MQTVGTVAGVAANIGNTINNVNKNNLQPSILPMALDGIKKPDFYDPKKIVMGAKGAGTISGFIQVSADGRGTLNNAPRAKWVYGLMDLSALAEGKDLLDKASIEISSDGYDALNNALSNAADSKAIDGNTDKMKDDDLRLEYPNSDFSGVPIDSAIRVNKKTGKTIDTIRYNRYKLKYDTIKTIKK